jgi:adenosine deaminase
METALDLPVLNAAHAFVHRQVAEMQVAIEINPSSNLLVGGFRSIFDQPVFHLADLPIVIGADDPLTFATTLSDDYAYAWAGMVLSREISPSEATRRVEEAARNSLRYAFDNGERSSARRIEE